MDLQLLIIFLLSSFTLVWALHFFARSTRATSSRLPPGPFPLPVIGNLLQLGTKPHKSLAKLASIHGPIMSLKLGQITTIVISSSTLAKETLQTHDRNLSDRTVPDATHAQDHHLSMEWLPIGAEWRNLRKICNSYIFANQKLDLNRDLRRQKLEQLIGDIQECCRESKAVNIGEVAFRTTLNTLLSSICSLDLTDSSSDRVREFKEIFRSIVEETGKPNLSDYFPFLRKIDPQGIRRRTSVSFGKLLGILDSMIDERIELRKKEEYIRCNDVLEILLNLNDEGNSSDVLDRQSIKHLQQLLFVPGADTTSSTLQWAMTELLRNPTTLLKARTELEQTIGKGRLVNEPDIAQLPYLQAVVKETLRLHPSVPLLLPRKARSDVEMYGFIIPKDAQILVNVWAIGRDGNIWKDPNSFFPERFLELDIDVRGRSFELIPFGGGRRICPGLPLATRILHVILGSLINKFDWKIEDGSETEILNMDDKFGLTLEKANPLVAIPYPVT
ncbi:geraniol 8-hydroxylase-like [Euphorbia lathyris]|uniref:geraniol 8-hydroxylase-like n=1 Tax=Euphorbia lathyris TaxID=212925 RepID=UPI0033130E3C